MQISKITILKILICILIIADIDYSYRQHEHKPIDGDLTLIVAPTKYYSTVLQEPFGVKAITTHEKYAATNRYFSHAMMVFYYKKVYRVFAPLVTNKTKFIYVFTGIFKTLLQILAVFLLCIYALKNSNVKRISFLLLFLFLSAFMQTNGYAGSIGIVDQSITYVFFYGLPLCLLMIYFIPFLVFKIEQKSTIFKSIFLVVWSLFALMISFTGSLIAPVGVLISVSILLFLFMDVYKSTTPSNVITRIKSTIQSLPWLTVSCLLFFILISFYSQYVGTFNIENGDPTTLSFRYTRLFEGLKTYFVKDLSFLLMTIVLVANFLIIKKKDKQIRIELKVILFLSVVYILLLPLGGYRPYRPNIIRSDTFMPVSLALLYLIGRTTYLASTVVKNKVSFYVFLSTIFFFFMYADKPHFTDNDCQYERVLELKNATSKEVIFDSKCPLMNWGPIYDTSCTMSVSRMLYYWQITDTIKPYTYQ